MSGQRSARLRSIIAATVSEAAENAAPVTITGSSLASHEAESRVKTEESREGNVATLPAESANPPAPLTMPHASEDHGAARQPDLPDRGLSLEPSPSPIATAQPASAVSPAKPITRPVLRAPEKPVKPPKWEKANFTLEARDIAILQRSDAEARAFGFRIRKGGNPSLFVRAGLRLLDELIDQDPEGWIKRIAATTSTGVGIIE